MNPNQTKLIVPAEWLKPGWILQQRLKGGLHVVKFELLPEPEKRAAALSTTLDRMIAEENGGGVFLAPEDCAIIQEFFPGLLKRTR